MSADVVAERRRLLPQWRAESLANLLDFGAMLGVDPPLQLVEDPVQGLPRAEQLLRDEDIDALSDEVYRNLTGKLMAFVGEVMIAEHKGEWIVDGDPDSPTYGRYVVGAGDRIFEPGAAVKAYLEDPAPRSLIRRIAEFGAL